MDCIGKKLKRTETGRKLNKSKHFSCFETFRNKIVTSSEKHLMKRWKYQAPFLVFQNTETMDYTGKKLKRTETGQKLTKSNRFSCFEMFRNKLWKTWKNQAPSLVFRNTETMAYIEKKLKRTETGRKLAKSKRFSRFETFQNKIETSSEKHLLKKVKIPGPISGVLKHWNNGLYREIIETDWKGRKLTMSKRFSCFETKLKQALIKVKIPGPKVFRNTETMDYIGKKMKRTETGRKLTKSKRFSCFEMFWNNWNVWT